MKDIAHHLKPWSQRIFSCFWLLRIKKSDVLTWLLIDIEIQTSKACRRGFIPAWGVLQNSLTGSNPVLSESNDMLWALIFPVLLTFQRRLWSSDAFCNMVSASISSKALFSFKKKQSSRSILLYFAFFLILAAFCLVMKSDTKSALFHLHRDLTWKVFCLKKEQLKLHGIY